MNMIEALASRRAKKEEHISQYDAAYYAIEDFYKQARLKDATGPSVSFESEIDCDLSVKFSLKIDGVGYYMTLEKTSGKSLPSIGGVCENIEKINYNISKSPRDAYIELEMKEAVDNIVFDQDYAPGVFWKEIATLSGPGITMLGQLLEKQN